VRTHIAATEPPQASGPRTVTSLRFTIFDALCNEQGLINDQRRAKALGISHPHLSRIRAGQCGAGSKVIRRALGLFSAVEYDDLFEERAL